MTQSGPSKKSPQPKVVVTKEEPVIEKVAPKSKLELLIERLKEEKPQTYELYVNAIKAKKKG